MMPRNGFPSSHVAYRQLVPYGDVTFTHRRDCRSIARLRGDRVSRPGRDRFSTRPAWSLALSRFPLTVGRCTNTLGLGRALLRGARVARQTCALGSGLVVTNRLGLRADRLRLRIANRLGQHPVQVSLGRSGGPTHLATLPFEFAPSLSERSTSIVGKPFQKAPCRVLK